MFLRAVLLLLWIALINIWLKRNVGFGWDDPGMISMIVAAAGTVLYLLGKAGRTEPEAWWQPVLLARSTLVVAPLHTAVAIPMALFSSVIVLNDPPGSALIASLTDAGQPTRTRKLDNLCDPNKGVQFTWVPHLHSADPIGCRLSGTCLKQYRGIDIQRGKIQHPTLPAWN